MTARSARRFLPGYVCPFVVALVAFLAILFAIPQRELDWEGTVLPLARRYADVEDERNGRPLVGIRIVVSGCTSGIGLALTRALSKMGATVIGIGRNYDRLQSMKTEIQAFDFVEADLANLSSVSRAADIIEQRWERIDILVNNAEIHEACDGAWTSAQSDDGYDRTFAVNYLAHFLLTEKLTPVILHESTKRPVMVHTSSMGHCGVDGSDLMARRKEMPLAARPDGGYHGFSLFRSHRAYSNSKMAQIYHARALRRKNSRWSSHKLARTVSVCPGFVKTKMASQLPFFLLTLLDVSSFPENGMGIGPLLVAILDTHSTGNGTCTVEGDECRDFYANSWAVPMHSFINKWCTLKTWILSCWGRTISSLLLTFLIIPFQSILFWLGPTKACPESYNEVIGNSLYYWSYQAILEYL